MSAGVWVVLETADYGDPIIAICQSEAEARAMAAAFDVEYGPDHPVMLYGFDRPPPSDPTSEDT